MRCAKTDTLIGTRDADQTFVNNPNLNSFGFRFVLALNDLKKTAFGNADHRVTFILA